MYRRFFTLCNALVALVLVLSLAMPVTAFADDGQPSDPTPEATEETPAEESADTPESEEVVTTEVAPQDEATEDDVIEAVADEETIDQSSVAEEAIAEVVETLAENKSILVDESGAPIPLGTEEASQLLSSGDPSGVLDDAVAGGYGLASGATFSYLQSDGGHPNGTCSPDTVTNSVICYWDTPLQKAVSDAAVNSTVQVEAGVYTEQVVISKTLTLQGSAGAIVKSPGILSTSFATSYIYKAIITVNAAEDVTISGLTVDGMEQGDANNRFVGIAFYNASGTISDNTVTSIMNSPLDGIQAGVGIYVYNGDSVNRTVNIDGNTVTDYQKGGIVANGAGLTAIITDNVVVGQGATPLIGANGIQISRGATGVISGNEISGNAWTGTYGGSNDPVSDPNADGSAGILLYFPGSGVVIDSNELTANQFGIWTVGAPDVDIHDNTITGLAHTGNAYPTGITISSRDLWSETGLSTIASVTNNTITGHDYGVLISDPDGSYPLDVTINNNSISGNGFGVYNTTSQTVDATNNYWGDASGPYDDSTLLADVCELALENAAATGDPVSGCVIYAPWLSSYPIILAPETEGNGEEAFHPLWYKVSLLAGSDEYQITELKHYGELDIYGIAAHYVSGAILVNITPTDELPTLSITFKSDEPHSIYVMLPDGSHYELPTTCVAATDGSGYECTAFYTPTGTEASLHPVFCLHD